MSEQKQKSKVGSVLKSKGGSFYIKMDADVSLKKDDVLFLKTPREDIASLVENKVMTQEQADERLAKIPDYVKFRISLPFKKG